MVKMSLDPVQVMSGQVPELKGAPSSNGDSRGSWEEKEEFNQDRLGLTTKPKSVSVTVPVFVTIILRLSGCEGLTLRHALDNTFLLIIPPHLPCCCLPQFIPVSQMFMLPTCSFKHSSKTGGCGVRQGEAEWGTVNAIVRLRFNSACRCTALLINM